MGPVMLNTVTYGGDVIWKCTYLIREGIGQKERKRRFGESMWQKCHCIS